MVRIRKHSESTDSPSVLSCLFSFREVGVCHYDVCHRQLSPLFQKVQVSVLRLCRMAAVPCAFRDIHDLFAGQIERLVVYVTVSPERMI